MYNEPVAGNKFFGREEVLDLLNKRVSALKDGYRQNVALTGQSLSGKSSIILHFLHMVKDDGFVPIYVEVVREPFKSFANKFIATMLYNALAKKGEKTGVDLDLILERAQKILPKTSNAIKNVYSSIDRAEMDEAYSGLLGLTSVLKDETGLSCVVILDEFDNLEHVGIKNPFLNFGKVIMVQKDTMYIVSSSRNSAIKKIISEKLSLLFGNFEVVKVSNFDLKTAGSFIEMKFSGFDIDHILKIFLISLTDGNPFYLDKITDRVKNLAIERMSSYIDFDIVSDAILDLVFNSGGAVHQYISNYLLDLLETKTRESHISILTAIAVGNNKQTTIAKSLKLKHSEAGKSLARLVDLGLVSKSGIFYKIDDVMLGFWLKFVRQRKKTLLVGGAFDKIRFFKQDIHSYMAEFKSETAKGVVLRISELFNLFSNELVSIDGKQIKMPHFTRVEVRPSHCSEPFIAASFRGSYWIIQPYEHIVTENDILDYIRNSKSLDCKISNKVIIPLKGIDENAKLIAKELKISIWDNSIINMLLPLFGREKIHLL